MKVELLTSVKNGVLDDPASEAGHMVATCRRATRTSTRQSWGEGR